MLHGRGQGYDRHQYVRDEPHAPQSNFLMSSTQTAF
jgi:hypothetical protein